MCGFLTWPEIIQSIWPILCVHRRYASPSFPIYSLDAFPNTLLGGLLRHKYSPCTDRPPYFSWYEQISAHLTVPLTSSPHFVYRKYVPLLSLFLVLKGLYSLELCRRSVDTWFDSITESHLFMHSQTSSKWVYHCTNNSSFILTFYNAVCMLMCQMVSHSNWIVSPTSVIGEPQRGFGDWKRWIRDETLEDYGMWKQDGWSVCWNLTLTPC